MNARMILGIAVLFAAIVLFTLWRKDDVSVSMSVSKILEFKLDAKEKSAATSKDAQQ
jgi:hypothetical protein